MKHTVAHNYKCDFMYFKNNDLWICGSTDVCAINLEKYRLMVNKLSHHYDLYT